MYFKENIWGIGAKYLLHSFAKENISKITKKTWGRAFQRKGIWILQEILSENQVVKKHNQTSALLTFSAQLPLNIAQCILEYQINPFLIFTARNFYLKRIKKGFTRKDLCEVSQRFFHTRFEFFWHTSWFVNTKKLC